MINQCSNYKRCFTLLCLAIIFNSCEKKISVEPDADKLSSNSSVYVDSNPQGASIYVDGKNSGFFTPDTLKWLDNGEHTLTLKMNYLFDTSLVFSSTSNEQIKLYVDYYQSERMLGAIVCNSNPKGAAIYLDNVNTGKVTPAVLNHLIPRAYRIKCEYPEYRKDSTDVVIKSMQTGNVFLDLDDTLDVVKYTTLNSDIPSNYISGMAEDKDGTIWIGTGSEGLAKFNGKKFINYRAENSSFVRSNYVIRVKNDKENNIWVGFSNAISRYDGYNWDSFSTDAISMINIMPDNTMLASTDRKGIVKYSNGQFEWITNSNSGMPYNELVSMSYDDAGRLWVAPRIRDLYYKNGNEWVKADSANDKLPYSHCCGMNISNDQKLIGYFYLQPNGPDSMAPHSMAIYRYGAWYKMFDNMIAFLEDKDLYVDKSNRTWFSYMNTFPVIARVSNIDFRREYFYNNIINRSIRKFNSWLYVKIEQYCSGRQAFIDSKGNLWLYGKTGLIKIKAGRWYN